ncbi:MAG: hypothetical protein Q8Q89_01890 [bacterium]|nr:hypothetical protein [bacterium]
MSAKNKLKLSKEVRRVFTGTEVGVLVEDFTSKIDTIAEQYGDIKHNIKSIKEGVGIIKESIEVIKMDIEVIKHDLKNKIGRDEFAVLERRVALLENRR